MWVCAGRCVDAERLEALVVELTTLGLNPEDALEVVDLQALESGGNPGAQSLSFPSLLIDNRMLRSGIQRWGEESKGQVAVGSVTPPAGGKPPSGPPPGPTGGADIVVDRLAHVLWLGIALFAIGFSYVRTAIAGRVKDLESRVRALEKELSDRRSDGP